MLSLQADDKSGGESVSAWVPINFLVGLGVPPTERVPRWGAFAYEDRTCGSKGARSSFLPAALAHLGIKRTTISGSEGAGLPCSVVQPSVADS